MALNPYTLNHLYEKGILEYVPTDLGVNIPLSPLAAMSNPYMDMAMQGGLYQGAINSTDTFTPMNNYGVQPIAGTYNGIGSMSNTGVMNTFLGNGVGVQNNSSISNTFGFNSNIGSNSNAGFYNSFTGNSVGEQHPGGGMNILGGFTDTKNNIKSGFYKTAAVVNNTPKVVLGLLASAIGAGGIMLAFKRGKKPPKTQNTSFLSKLNPLNWRKKK